VSFCGVKRRNINCCAVLVKVLCANLDSSYIKELADRIGSIEQLVQGMNPTPSLASLPCFFPALLLGPVKSSQF